MWPRIHVLLRERTFASNPRSRVLTVVRVVDGTDELDELDVVVVVDVVYQRKRVSWSIFSSFDE